MNTEETKYSIHDSVGPIYNVIYHKLRKLDNKQRYEWRSINDSIRDTLYRSVGGSVHENMGDIVWGYTWRFVGVYAVILAQKLKEYDYNK